MCDVFEIKLEDEDKDLRPRTRTWTRTQLFVLEAPRGRGQVLDDTSLAYSSSCSQTVSLSPAISSQFILRVCAAAEDRKNQL